MVSGKNPIVIETLSDQSRRRTREEIIEEMFKLIPDVT